MYSLFLWYRYKIAFALAVLIGITQVAQDYYKYGVGLGILFIAGGVYASISCLYSRTRWGYGFVALYSAFFTLLHIVDLIFLDKSFNADSIFQFVIILLSAPLFLISLTYYRNSKVWTLAEDELIAKFIQISQSPDLSKKSSKSAGEIWRVYAALKHKDKNLTKLAELLEHDNDEVKGIAAFFLLAKHEDRALETLDKLCDKEGKIAVHAQYVTDQWRKGDREPFKYLTP